jgi:hypothetical protein
MNRPTLVASRTPVQAGKKSYDWIFQIAFILANAAAFPLIPKHSNLATWHGMATVALAILVALLSRNPVHTAYSAAYITGAEVFWRMRKAEIPWEIGKYCIVLICVIALIRSGRLRRFGLPTAYLLLLAPSCLLTAAALADTETRDQLSFNLAGPIALAVCTIFFSNLRMTRTQLQWLCVFVIGPAAGIATVGALNIQAFSPIEFGGGSNAIASGGFGPNQVSAALGLAIVMVSLFLILGRLRLVMVGAMIALMMFLVGQCAVTFSRAGLYLAIASIAAAVFFLFQDSRYRRRILLAGVVVVGLLIQVVIPRLQDVTGGAVTGRFQNADSTGRVELMAADIETFELNPLLGVGPGLGGAARAKAYYVTTAHTEYTRMLAEHGVFGLAAIGVLLAIAFLDLRRGNDRRRQAFAAALLVFSLMYLAVDATRMVAVSFTFGLASVGFAYPRRRRPAARPAELPAPGRALRRGA